MGLITTLKAKRAAKRGGGVLSSKETSSTVLLNGDGDSDSSSSAVNPSFKKKWGKLKSFRSDEASMDHLPDLVLELETAVETSSSRTIRSLKMLFSLSEDFKSRNRFEMAQWDEGGLIPALLNFLKRCAPKSREQYLTLLVLNNMSIPAENKSVIGMKHEGVQLLSRLLCSDPSCHLIAIILVNLSFTDTEGRKELLSAKSGTGLIESLAFALRLSSLTPEEYNVREPFFEGLQDEMSPLQRLLMFMAEDERIRSGQSRRGDKRERMIDLKNQKFPETARWCLTAIKNLSRPCQDSSVAQVLAQSKVLDIIFRYITIPDDVITDASTLDVSDITEDSVMPAMKVDEIKNVPHLWDCSSIQDAALYIVMNLCACDASRTYLDDKNAISILCLINVHQSFKRRMTEEQRIQLEFQCLKARMALAYLVGSEGHFGQAIIKSSSSTLHGNPREVVLVMTESEVETLIELLANSLHERGKDGPGGYSEASSNVKYVLFALRCLLVHTLNQSLMVMVAGRILNSLLVKVLALHSSRMDSNVDVEAAEYACFSLYLLSNYGFENPFLPTWLTNKDDKDSLSAKVLTSYLHMKNITPAGRHAAEQLLLRLKYMVFEGDVADIAPAPKESVCLTASDLTFEKDITSKMMSIQIGKRIHGAKPRDDIFSRPILRRRKPKNGNIEAPWDNQARVSAFPSALQAVQQLSFGSVKVRHLSFIDDVLIANNIAKSANGQRTESYYYMWSWEDTASEIQYKMSLQRSDLLSPSTFTSEETDRRFFSRFSCLACGADTTI